MKDGALTGIDIDIVEEMAKRLSLDIKIVSAIWKGVMLQIKAGRVDGGFAAFLNQERQQFSLYTAPVHYEAMHLFVNQEKTFPFTSLRDLDGKVIGKESGAFISEAFQQAEDSKRFIVHEGINANNLKMLGLNRLDGVIGNLEVMQYHLKTLKLSQKIIPLVAIGKKQAAYLILSKESKYPNIQKLQQRIKNVLENMQIDGSYQRIANQHLMEEPD